MNIVLHLINRNTTLRLLAAFLCLLLLTSIQAGTSGLTNALNTQINSLRLYPTQLNENDSLFLIVNATLNSSSCGLQNYEVNVSNNEIAVTASFWQGDALAICTFEDTLFIGNFDKGEYLVTFNFADSLQLKIPALNSDKCKADFTVLYPNADSLSIPDGDKGMVQFYDLSHGKVVSWHWNFGDGNHSKNQHPQHMYTASGQYHVCLKITTEEGCESKICKTIRVNTGNECNLRGTVINYSGLDGCGFIIELDNGSKLEAVKYPDDIELHDSMRVKLSYVPVNAASICMVGQPAIITCIEEINLMPCHAGFSILRDSLTYEGDKNYTYWFNNNSRGDGLQYEWDFGDGTTSSEIHPVHTFTDTGLFTICLKIYNQSGCEDHYCVRLWVGQNNQTDCKADFTYTYTPCDQLPFDYCPGYFVQFTDESVGDALLYHWDFGDGNVSYERHPNHYYEKPGIYPVTLKIESATDVGYCSDRIVKQVHVAVPDTGCQAYFRYEEFTPYHFKFHSISNRSLKIASTYKWDFGDGTTAYGQSVEHVFEGDGIYRVCLTVTTENGCTSSYCDEIIVGDQVNNECKATFNYEYLGCECVNCACLSFTSNTTDDVIEWFWDFGDGNYSREPDPFHTYFNLKNRAYTVCLTVTTASGCTSRYCERVSVYGGGHEVPWKPVIAGEENHVIIVPDNIRSPDLQQGDCIGLFFEDNNGQDVCGGYIEWKGEVNTLTAWGNTVEIWMSVMKNGFAPGETFKYKIWKHATNQVIDITQAVYETDALITDSSAYRDNGISKLKALISCDKQRIRLHKGWNLISLNVEPSDKKMKSIFGNNQNVLVKDATGNIEYFPHAGIYDGEWDILEGYKVKVWHDTRLHVCGTSIDPKTIIPLNNDSYPDFLPYYYPFEYPVASAFREITDDIRYVQSLEYLDGSGVPMALNYIPAYGINQIGNMKPGLAYKLSLVNPWRSFTYPDPFTVEDLDNYMLIDSINRNTATNRKEASFENSERNRVLVIPENVLPLKPGVEINVYTSDDFFVGSWLYKGEGNTAITLWDNPEMPDYTEFEIRVIDSSQNELDRYIVNVQDDVHTDGTLMELKKATITSTTTPASAMLRIYPNPASDFLRFSIPDNMKNVQAVLKVLSLDGRTVMEKYMYLLDDNELDVRELKSGVYLLQLQTEDNMYKTKFVISK